MKKAFLLSLVVILSVLLNSASFAIQMPDYPQCYVKGQIQNVEFKEAVNRCATDDPSTCPTDIPFSDPALYKITIKIISSSYVAGSTEGGTCELLFSSNAVSDIFVNKEDVKVGDSFAQGQIIEGTTSSAYGRASTLGTYKLTKPISLQPLPLGGEQATTVVATITELRSNPSAYDGKEIVVTGTVKSTTGVVNFLGKQIPGGVTIGDDSGNQATIGYLKQGTYTEDVTYRTRTGSRTVTKHKKEQRKYIEDFKVGDKVKVMGTYSSSENTIGATSVKNLTASSKTAIIAGILFVFVLVGVAIAAVRELRMRRQPATAPQ